MRLNLSTRHFHADVDEPWLELLRPTVGVSDYLAVLVRTYGLVAPFESACKYTPGLARFVDFRQLMRAGLIAQDLLSLGLTPAQVAAVPTCASFAIFRNVPEALGWLYLVERSTLLHDGIRRHLAQHLPAVDTATAYITIYEHHVADHWATFGRVLDRVGSEPDVATEIIAAAHNAFATATRWYGMRHVVTRNAG